MPEIKTNIIEEINEVSSLRPQTLKDYIGQSKIKENLSVFINACKLRNDTLEHVLLYGSAGLGKTTLASIIANELGRKIHITSAPAIEKSGEMASILSKLEEGDVLFIDEIHRLPKVVEETLYTAMEDFAIDILLGEGSSTRSIRLSLPKFTLIGATTRAGSLSAPLRDRFGISFRLEYYTPEELSVIASNTASKLNISLDKDAALLIGECGRGTPRITNRITKRICDFALVKNLVNIDIKLVEYALDRLLIRRNGLDENDLLIINTIKDKFNYGPVGLDTLSASIGEDKETIESVYEPYLIFKGFILKTPRGRILNEHKLKEIA